MLIPWRVINLSLTWCVPWLVGGVEPPESPMPPASPDESGATPRQLGGPMGRLVGINVDGNYKGNPDPPIIMVFSWNMGGCNILQYECPEYLG